jgi:hypothetical protein
MISAVFADNLNIPVIQVKMVKPSRQVIWQPDHPGNTIQAGQAGKPGYLMMQQNPVNTFNPARIFPLIALIRCRTGGCE